MTKTIPAPRATKPRATKPAAPTRPTREQRIARGKAARAEVPRASHAEFVAGQDRTDPLTLLQSQDGTRVPELLPIRYGRMASSAFAFFRGAALPMASDLAATPRSGLTVAGLRRRPPVELRRVRLPGAASRLRHQRLRRDPARAVGVGRQTARRPASRSPGGPTATPAKVRAIACWPRWPRTGGRCGVRRRRIRWRSGTPTPTWPRSRPWPPGRCGPAAQDARPQHRQGADQGQPRGAGAVRRRSGRRAAAEGRAAAGRAHPRPVGRPAEAAEDEGLRSC